jgi:hypothetical protein
MLEPGRVFMDVAGIAPGQLFARVDDAIKRLTRR